MGVHLHAGRGPGQGGQEERQAGEEDPGQPGESFLGRVQAAPGPGQHHGDGHKEDVQTQSNIRSRTNARAGELSPQQAAGRPAGHPSPLRQF